MEEKIKQFMIKHKLVEQNSTIIVGVSGGPDSLALLHFLWMNRVREGWNIVAAHIDHMFRGEESAKEMEFVQTFCEKLGIPCEVTQIDVTGYQKELGISSQLAARQCRFGFFSEVMEKHESSCLALAQHGDDQVETILMRLVRGSLGKASAGIMPKRPFFRGYVIRPLLSVSKEEICTYCEEYELKPRFDPSNLKDVYTRNRFRNAVLPFLKQENPNVHTHFQQFSERLIEDDHFLEELTRERMNTVIRRKEQKRVELSIKAFLDIPIPLQKRGLHLILNYLYHTVPSSLSFLHIEQILHLIIGDHPSGTLNLPKALSIKRSYDQCMFMFEEDKVYMYSYYLKNKDKIVLPNGQELWVEEHREYPATKSNFHFVLESTAAIFPLTVRNRKQGDKIQLKGMNGSKKIKDIFIDEKIPLYERDSWPIIEDQEGHILWIPGLKKSRFETDDKNQSLYRVLFFKRQ